MLGPCLLSLALAAGSALAQSYVGCYSTAGSLTTGDKYDWQSDGHCFEVCKAKQASVFAMTGASSCLCGSSVPSSGLVDSSMCNLNCTGWPTVKCGGTGYYSFYNAANANSATTGTAKTDGSSTTSAPTGTTATPSVVTSILPDRTIIVTQSAVARSGSSDSATASTTNTGAIAGGVAGGVIVILAIAGAVFFFTRRSRRAHQDAYQRHSGQALVAGGNRPSPPPMSQSRGSPETRYDAEAMANRRLSDGSIADNEDFSRRILKVTNPDDRI